MVRMQLETTITWSLNPKRFQSPIILLPFHGPQSQNSAPRYSRSWLTGSPKCYLFVCKESRSFEVVVRGFGREALVEILCSKEMLEISMMFTYWMAKLPCLCPPSSLNYFPLITSTRLPLSALLPPLLWMSFSLYSFPCFSLAVKCFAGCEWLNCWLQGWGTKRHVTVSRVSPLYPAPSIITEQG